MEEVSARPASPAFSHSTMCTTPSVRLLSIDRIIVELGLLRSAMEPELPPGAQRDEAVRGQDAERDHPESNPAELAERRGGTTTSSMRMAAI